MLSLILIALLGLSTATFASLWLGERRKRMAAEQAGEEARRRREEADAAREGFFDLATHELRSPLSAILGYQELLADGAYGPLQEGAEEPVDRIGRSARHLLHLIDGVIELSRIRVGGVRPDLDSVHLGVLFSAAADAFRVHARERNIEPRISVPASLHDIRSDQDRLIRCIDLLMASALKHPAEPYMSLEVSALSHGFKLTIGPTAIDVKDDQADPATQYGIRIAVAQGIATLLGGSLEMDTGHDGEIRALTLRIRELESGPASGFDAGVRRG